MDIDFGNRYGKYLVYPNESIDKITVNRSFERMFGDIESRSENMSLELSTATTSSYGKAKFSPSASYSFDLLDGDSDYENSMLNISQMYDMSKRFVDGSSESIYVAPVSSDETSTLPMTGNRYWVSSKYMNSKFMFMPNGINMVTFSFEIGFNGLANAMDDDSIVDSDVISPVYISGYEDVLSIDNESYDNIMDFVNDGSYVDANDVKNIFNMDGRSMEIPFIERLGTTLRHNNCSSTKDSAYNQSYIELCMSGKVSVKSLFERKYGIRTYETITESSSVCEVSSYKVEDIKRVPRLFTQKPIVMGQVSFFNNSSNPLALFGFDNYVEGKDYMYLTFNEKCGLNILIRKGDSIKVDSQVDGISFWKLDGVDGEVVDDEGNITVNFVWTEISETEIDERMVFFEKPLSGYVERHEQSFSNYSRLSQKPLDEVDVDGEKVSPVNGNVFIKGVDNTYDSDGNVIDNVLSFDIIMKFMAGSPTDPEMEYAIKNLNSRARVQLAIIGV